MKTILLAATLGLFSVPVMAAEWEQTAYVSDHYDTLTYDYTEYKTRCEYVKSNNAGTGALGGMVIGGIIGKGLTGDNNGAAAGAIIGGVIGADRGSQNQHARQICKNVPVKRQKTETVYSHSVIRFWHNNRWVELDFQR
jgi:outer membrane lipoprotein SlyB